LSVAEFVFKIIYRLKYDLSPCPLPDLTQPSPRGEGWVRVIELRVDNVLFKE
jgi:hypothetical protein